MKIYTILIFASQGRPEALSYERFFSLPVTHAHFS